MSNVPRFVQEWLIVAAERYPLWTSGLICVAGVAAGFGAVLGAAPFEEFRDGERVIGTVISVSEDPERDPRYGAEVSWVTEGLLPWEDVRHQALVKVDRRELPDPRAKNPQERLGPGSAVALIVSTQRPDAAISEKALGAAHLVTVGGTSGLGSAALISALFLLGGIASVIQVLNRRKAGQG